MNPHMPLRTRNHDRLERAVGILPLAMAAVLLGLKGAQPRSDPDGWWHLRAGEYVVKQFRLASPEPWVTFADRRWVMHEWLSEAIAWLTWRALGEPGLIALHTAVLMLLLLALWACCRDSADALPASLSALFAAGALLPFMAERPQLISFVLVAVAGMAWRRSARDGRTRWWLLPLTWLWACLHGLWIMSPAVGAVALLGMLLDRGLHRRLIANQAALVVGLFVVGGLTPIGPRLLVAPFDVRAQSSGFITEWAAPSTHLPSFILVLMLLGIPVAVALRSNRPAAWSLFVHLGFAAVLLLAYQRTVALAAVVAAPLAAAALQQLRGPARARWERRDVLVPAGVLCATLATVVVTVSAQNPPPPTVSTGLTADLRQLPRGTVIFNAYELGGWLLWDQRQLTPVIDGRNDLYSVARLNQYATALSVSPGWENAVAATGAETALLPLHSPLAYALAKQGWRAVRADGGYVLLRSSAASSIGARS